MGRTSLIMVLGTSMILMMMGYRLSNVSTSAYENMTQYYYRTASHNLATAFTNMGCQVIYRTPNARPQWTDVPLSGGKVSLWTTSLTLGRVQLTATSNYMGCLDTVIVVWGQSRFSKFAYYSVIEGAINWANKDTIYGPFHTQDRMLVNGNPVFWGKATNRLGITRNPTSSRPQFYGGYQTGIDIPMPSDFNPLITAAQSGGKYLNGMDLTITFNSDGTLTVKEGGGATTRVPLSTYAPNGALMVNGGNIRIKGKFTGQLTISAQSNGVANKGKVYIDSSVNYVHDPLTGSSNDLLGICAEDSVVITDNTNNRNGIDIEGSVFSLNKGMGAEHYSSGSPRGRINLLGGVSQQQRAAVGTIDGSGNVVTGYSKSYRYDDRLMNQSPPFFPTTGSYEILSWYER
jgi:hypothetical protein